MIQASVVRADRPSNYQGRVWTEEETSRLKELHRAGVDLATIAALLDRTYTAISNRCRYLGLVRRPRWTYDMLEEVKHLFSQGLTRRQVAERLGVPYYRVVNLCDNTTIKPPPHHGRIDRELLAALWMEGLPIKVISVRLAEATGSAPVQVSSISRAAHELGLPNIREVRRKLREGPREGLREGQQ